MPADPVAGSATAAQAQPAAHESAAHESAAHESAADEPEFLLVDDWTPERSFTDEILPPAKDHRDRIGRPRWQWLAIGGGAVIAAGLVLAGALNAGGKSGSTARGSAPAGSATPVASAPDPRSPTGATADTPVPVVEQRIALVTWVRSNLSPNAVIVADSNLASQLQLAHFSKVVAWGDLAGVDLQTVEYVLDVPGDLDSAPRQSQLLASSLPVAVFSAGQDAVSARQVFAAGVSAMPARQARDAALRRRGGTELSHNRSLRITEQIAALLRSGQLDLRALNALNALASTGTLSLAQVLVDPNEQRAGLPPRSVVITTANPRAVQRTLASMSAPIQPDTVVAVSQSKFSLTWKPAIASVATFGN